MRRILGTLLLPLAFAACSSAPESSVVGDTFRYRLSHDPPDMDPARAHDTASEVVVFEIFDGLLELDPETLRPVPAVAESWDISPDARTYTFRLREGVRFHHGREVTAADVVYSFERALRPATRAARPWLFAPVLGAEEFRRGDAGQVAGFAAPDERTVRITLERPYAPFLSHLVLEQASILPREIYEDPGERYLQEPVGCGPFRMGEWRRGQSLVLEAFDGYYGEGPHVARIQFYFIESQETALQEYLAGNLELTDEVPSGRRADLKAQLGDQYRRWPQLANRFFLLNQARPPFAGNLALRRAVNHAVDREYILRVLDEGKDVPLYGVIPPGLPSHDPDLEGYRYDPDRARALLAEAGYPEGRGLPELTLLYNTNEGHRRICTRVAADLAAIGIKVRLVNLDIASFLEAIAGTPDHPPDAEIIYFSWVADFPDAFNFLYPNLHSNNLGGGGNYTRYSNPEFDRLVDEAAEETDTARRIDLYRQAERVAVDDAVWLFFYSMRDEAIVRPEVEDLVLSPLGDFAIPLNRVRLRRAGG